MTSTNRYEDAPPAGEIERVSAAEVAREARDVAKSAARTARRYRYGLAPLATMGALAGSGALAHTFEAPSLAVAAGTIAAGAAGTYAARRRLNSLPRRWWAGAVTCCSATWIGVTTAVGIAEPMPGLLAAATAVLGAPWWYHYRNRLRLPEQAPPPPPPPAERPAPLADPIWTNKVVAKDGPLGGAMEEGWTRIENGRTTGVWLPDDAKILTDAAIKQTLQVTQLYRKRIGEVMIERHEDRREGHIQVTVFDQLPLAEASPWTGPQMDPKVGIAPIGPYADGRGQASIRLFDPDNYGIYHTLVSGGTGSGKSVVLSMIIAEIEHSGVGVTWLIDPQGGQSIPDWANSGKISKKATSTDEAFELLKAAEAVMYANSDYLTNLEWVDEDGDKRVGKGWFEPTPEMPFLALVIDEAHLVLKDPKFADIVGDIAKMGRKAGVMLILATQTPTQDELGGKHGGKIRDNVGMGNKIVLRTQSSMTAPMLKTPVDPVNLPPGGGFGFIEGPASPRKVMMRAAYTKKYVKWAQEAPGTRLHQFAEDAVTRVMEKRRSGSKGESLMEKVVDWLLMTDSGGVASEMHAAGLSESWSEIQNVLMELERRGAVVRKDDRFQINPDLIQGHALTRLINHGA